MKKIGIYLSLVLCVTALSVVYIYQNIRVMQRSYAIQAKEGELVIVSDEYRQLSYEVNALRSPERLENSIHEAGINLIHPTDVRFIKNIVVNDKGLAAHGVQMNMMHYLELMPEAHASSSRS